MTEPMFSTVTTKIGKVTYAVVSAASPLAKDTMIQKIKKNIKRDLEKNEDTI